MIQADIIDDEQEDVTDKNDITPLEQELLDNAGGVMDEDDLQLKGAQLDNTDTDGTPLNEKAGADDLTGADLDIPGSELDDEDEEIGEEDEENNNYSQADTE